MSVVDFKQLIDSIQESVIISDKNGIIIYINQAGVEILGYDNSAQILGTQTVTLYADPKQRESLFAELLQVGTIKQKKILTNTKEGHLELEVDAKTILDSDGEVSQIHIFGRDISERTKMEQELVASESRFRGLFENLIFGYGYQQMVYDEHGKPVDYIFLAVNEAFEHFTGFAVDDIVGKRVTEVLPGIENEPEDLIGTYGKIASEGGSLVFEQFAESLGMWYYIQAYSTEKGYFTTIFQNITDRKKAEQEVEFLARFPEENTNPVLRINNEGTILYANRAATHDLSNLASKIGDKVSGDWLELLSGVLSSGESSLVERVFGDRIYSFNLAPIVESGYVNVYGRDITDQKRAETEIVEGDKRLRSFLDSMDIGFTIWDKDLNYVDINQTVLDRFELSREEMIGMNIVDVNPLVDRASRIESYKQVIMSGEPFASDDAVLLTAKGERRFSVRAYKVGNGVGNMSRDITNEKKEEDTLLAERALFESLINPESKMLEITSKILEQAQKLTNSTHGFVSEIDQQTGDNVGLTITNMMDTCKVHGFQVLFPVEHDGSYSSLLGRSLNEKKSFYTNKPDSHKNRSGAPEGHIPIKNLLSVPVLLGGAIVGQINLANSIMDYSDLDVAVIERLANVYALATHRIRTEKERDLANQQAIEEKLHAEHEHELSELKNKFISTATHELRTPVTSILGYIDFMLQDKSLTLPEEATNDLKIVLRNANRLLTLTNDLLDLQRITTGRLEIYPSEFDFTTLVTQTVEELTPLIQEKNQTLQLDIPEILPISGDETRLSQLLINLLRNANKFTPNDGKISLHVETIEDRVRVRIKDSGIGMDEEDIEKLFKPFPGINHGLNVTSSGLGLSISKGIVELHNGAIWAESEGKGKGSTFSFTLPLRK